MTEAFIVGGVRTAIGSYGGALSSVRADDLAAFAIQSLMLRYPGVPKESIGDVILGCANQSGEDNRNVARMAALLAGLPISVPGLTVNRLCASGLEATAAAAKTIKSGESEIMLAGGVEQMSRAPWVMAKPTSAFARNPEVFDTTMGWRFVNPKLKELYNTHSMGETAEEVASQWQISREEQDRFALLSQQKCKSAIESGRFDREIAPIQVPTGKGQTMALGRDEFPRPDTTIEALAKLRPAFKKDGSVTAGNSSGINDGAAVLLLASAKALSRHSLQPLARVVASSVVGVEPRTMGIGPVPAVRQLLERTGIKLDQISVLELNEAFAAQGLACLKELGLKPEDPRINPNGGAIALGHPLGMSGARLALTAAHELIDKGGQYAICTMCVGVGQGMAVLIERA
jgi:acetyl-CoA acyltransferase